MMRQLVQEEKNYVGIDRAVGLLHGGGIFIEEGQLARICAQFTLGVRQFVVDDVGDQHPFGPRFERCADYARDHIAKGAGGEVHSAHVAGDGRHQAVILKQ